MPAMFTGQLLVVRKKNVDFPNQLVSDCRMLMVVTMKLITKILVTLA